MPTTRPRHTITETDKVARALRRAAKRWPAERNARGKLLLHLIEEGERSIAQQDELVKAAYREAVESTSGMFTDVYPEGYLEELRKDWPE